MRYLTYLLTHTPPAGQCSERDQALQQILEAGVILQEPNWFENGGDELFVGRAGFLCAVLWLRKHLNTQVVCRVAFILPTHNIQAKYSYYYIIYKYIFSFYIYHNSSIIFYAITPVGITSISSNNNSITTASNAASNTASYTTTSNTASN